ncbi:hypothetical protein ISCGN_021716 [Ixodes scapularis]
MLSWLPNIMSSDKGKKSASGPNLSPKAPNSGGKKSPQKNPSPGQAAQEVSLVDKVQNSDSAVVVVLGGIDLHQPDDFSVGKSALVFKPQLNQWLSFEPLPEPRNYHAVVFYGGCIYVLGQAAQEVSLVDKVQNSDSAVVVVLGGIDLHQPDDFSVGKSALVFKPQLNQWLSFEPLPEPRNYHAVVFYGGCIYVLGGYNPQDVIKEEPRSQRSVFRFIVKSRQWDRVADMRHARACLGATVVHEKIMAVGGKDDHAEILQSVEVYNPASDTWVMYKNLPIPIMGCGVAFLSGMVYVVGGVTTKRQVFTGMVPAEVLSTVYATDPDERAWVRRPSLPEPRAYTTALTIHHELWIVGGLKTAGRDPAVFSNVTEVLAFDSLRGRWEFRFKMLRPRHGVAAASADDRVYVMGGMTCLDGSSVDDVDVFHRQRLTFLDCQCLPRTITGLAAVTLPPESVDSTPTPKGAWPPSKLELDSSTFLGVGELKLRTPMSRPSLPRFYHYVPVAPTNDPHHGITVKVDDDFQKTKEVLGLRDAIGLPAFAKKLRRVRKIQDETLPVILTFGGLDPRDPLNYANGRVVLHYHVLKNRWDLCGMMPEPRSYHGAVLIGGTVYITEHDTLECSYFRGSFQCTALAQLSLAESAGGTKSN